MKITKRDITLITLTAFIMCIPIAMIARYKQRPEMTSCVFDWKDMKVTKNATGEKRQVFDTPTKTLQNLECHITTLNVGETAHPPHQHPDEEMLIIKEGTAEALVNGQLKRVGPGSIIFQASNILHNIKNVGTTPTTYYVVRWTSSKTVK
jgi:quercetin dioxygenase-like cupin family protein